MRERVDNEAFFAGASAARTDPAVAEAVFYAGRARPAAEVAFAVRAAATPVRFAMVIFLVGWAGILFQASFLQQVVFGAPVFEELAKFGPPLLLVAALRVRSLWIRLPLAWASGAAFGVMEHYVTYAGEPFDSYMQRIAFHAIAPGVSMLFYDAFEDLADVRSRWAATVPATFFHWLNNFAAVLLGFGGVFVAFISESAGLVVGALVVSGMVVLTVTGIVAPRGFRETARAALSAAIPRVALK